MYGYQAVKRAGYTSTPFFEDELVLLVRRDKNAFPRGVTKGELRKLPCAMCNFSLEEIGSYLRELFPAGQVFPFEVDNSNKVQRFSWRRGSAMPFCRAASSKRSFVMGS